MTLAIPRKFHREMIIPCGILGELSEVILTWQLKTSLGN